MQKAIRGVSRRESPSGRSWGLCGLPAKWGLGFMAGGFAVACVDRQACGEGLKPDAQLGFPKMHLGH